MVLGRIKVSRLWTLWQSTGQSVAVVFVEALWLFSARDASCMRTRKLSNRKLVPSPDRASVVCLIRAPPAIEN